jgi:hypothetical protein
MEKNSKIILSFTTFLAVCLMTFFQIPPLESEFLFEIVRPLTDKTSVGATASLNNFTD